MCPTPLTGRILTAGSNGWSTSPLNSGGFALHFGKCLSCSRYFYPFRLFGPRNRRSRPISFILARSSVRRLRIYFLTVYNHDRINPSTASCLVLGTLHSGIGRILRHDRVRVLGACAGISSIDLFVRNSDWSTARPDVCHCGTFERCSRIRRSTLARCRGRGRTCHLSRLRLEASAVL
ncbi:hypothetical protein BC828DRAFT_234727 [Blastocladiella britannica]|nr:hypothetical protein BC828DRAFT_234727 [Blastocladiella britannica]